MDRKRAIWVWSCCLVVCVLVVVMGAAAQLSQEKKAFAVQTSAQDRYTYQKMVQSQTLTQQMAQNQYAYQNKNQDRTSNRKMTQTGKGSDAHQGRQGSRSGNAGGGNG